MTENPEFKFCLNDDLSELCEKHYNKYKPEDFLPQRSYDTDTGWDVRCAIEDDIDTQDLIYHHGKNDTFLKIPLGFRIFSPKGWWLNLHPRSSTFAKKFLVGLVGIIDESYEGKVYFGCKFDPECPNVTLRFGDKIGQLIPIKREIMKVTSITKEELDLLCKNRNAERGSGGFGSTG